MYLDYFNFKNHRTSINLQFSAFNQPASTPNYSAPAPLGVGLASVSKKGVALIFEYIRPSDGKLIGYETVLGRDYVLSAFAHRHFERLHKNDVSMSLSTNSLEIVDDVNDLVSALPFDIPLPSPPAETFHIFIKMLCIEFGQIYAQDNDPIEVNITQLNYGDLDFPLPNGLPVDIKTPVVIDGTVSVTETNPLVLANPLPVQEVNPPELEILNPMPVTVHQDETNPEPVKVVLDGSDGIGGGGGGEIVINYFQKH